MNFGKIYTVKHFIAEGIAKSTVYSILRRQANNINADRIFGSGRKPIKMKPKDVNSMIKRMNNSDNISYRQIASKYKISKSYAQKIVQQKSKIKRRKKEKIPHRTEKQQILAKIKCGRLYRKFARSNFVMDDESYFTLSNTSINGNDGFYTDNINECSPDVKYKNNKKFEEKIMVWVAISCKGLCKPYYVPSKLAVNQKIYLDECIKKRLIPFIEQNHVNDDYVFWPDLASSHYAKSVTDHLREKNINFVSKQDNPACLPEVRPIEDFWSLLKADVYKNGWKAKNIQQLKHRIQYCFRKVGHTLVQRLIETVKKRIDCVRRNGVKELK